MAHFSDLPSDINSTAALWVIKTAQDKLTAEEELQFQLWMNASEQHFDAYCHARQLWSLTESMPRESIPTSTSTRKLINSKAVTKRHYSWLSMAAAVIFSVLSVFFWYERTHEVADYQAKVGEVMHITLPDGSLVDLDSGAKLTIAFNDNFRQVNLLAGRAYFTAAPVSKVESRPFRVAAKEGFIQALGTEFLVDNNDEQVDVSVYQHSVKIYLLSGQEVTVNTGDSTHYQQQIWPVSTFEERHSTAWRQGQIIFHQRILADVVAEISRYRDKPVFLLGAQTDQRVSGVFQVKSIEGALSNLAASRNLAIYEMPFFTLIY